MARTKPELVQLLADLKNWFELDLGQLFQHDVLLGTFDEMTKTRLAKFMSRRLGHLPDVDYFNFCNVFAEDMKGTLENAPVRVPVEEPVVIKAVEDALEVAAIPEVEVRRPRGRPKKAG